MKILRAYFPEVGRQLDFHLEPVAAFYAGQEMLSRYHKDASDFDFLYEFGEIFDSILDEDLPELNRFFEYLRYHTMFTQINRYIVNRTPFWGQRYATTLVIKALFDAGEMQLEILDLDDEENEETYDDPAVEEYDDNEDEYRLSGKA